MKTNEQELSYQAGYLLPLATAAQRNGDIMGAIRFRKQRARLLRRMHTPEARQRAIEEHLGIGILMGMAGNLDREMRLQLRTVVRYSRRLLAQTKGRDVDAACMTAHGLHELAKLSERQGHLAEALRLAEAGVDLLMVPNARNGRLDMLKMASFATLGDLLSKMSYPDVLILKNYECAFGHYASYVGSEFCNETVGFGEAFNFVWRDLLVSPETTVARMRQSLAGMANSLSGRALQLARSILQQCDEWGIPEKLKPPSKFPLPSDFE